jgi:hypothetical protein
LDCSKRKIIKVNDFKYLFGDWQQLNDAQLIVDDVFEVTCKKNGRVYYDNLFAQIVNKLSKPLSEKVVSNENNKSNASTNVNKCKPLNVILISYDSVSRSSWFNRVPKATKYALENMKFELLHGYNIVGDGTPGLLKHYLIITFVKAVYFYVFYTF